MTGHRLLRGSIFPGVSSIRRLPAESEINNLDDEFAELIEFISSNSVVMDRFEGTATLGAEDAHAIGTLGVVARASGLPIDARNAHPFAATGSPVPASTQSQGDVLARFNQRVEELQVLA